MKKAYENVPYATNLCKSHQSNWWITEGTTI